MLRLFAQYRVFSEEVDEAMELAGPEVVLRTSRLFRVADASPGRRAVKGALDWRARSRVISGPLIIMVARKTSAPGPADGIDHAAGPHQGL